MTFDASAFRSRVRTLLEECARAFDDAEGRHAVLRRQIDNGDDIHSRSTFPGHVTASAFILDGAGKRIVLIHHRSLGRWLQPGGHYEAPEALEDAALREAFEETGAEGLALDPWHRLSGLPIDIDSHLIPARPQKGEPEHWHHDIRYIVRAEEGSLRPDLGEVHSAEWRAVTELEGIAPEALRNMRRLGLVRP
ncbi:NUDIX domain-containing protein [Microvirga sp. ACRRW]|uniref:NUDIX hydrolase n=1 Tax=Microvirga sp. ACRRW TaxID=2918205 RepID=UPI001EF67363|nr:NUDIX domain-containing protein [Microvirga sp. ACRRW]MCG7392206.1 NUDIX domain-containing protein [Microvirga sp. ACRRW]